MDYIREHGTDAGPTSCEACVTGKACWQLFINTTNNRYDPLEALSTDTTGPLSAADIEGNKYLQLLADVGGGWTDGHSVRAKSGAPEAILWSLPRLQLLSALPIKRLQSDNASEQDTKAFRNFLGHQGT